MKAKRSRILLIFLFILSIGYSVTPSSANVTQTGFDVLFKLKSVQVVDDCDSTSDGDWHIVVRSAIGNQLYYSGEVTIGPNGFHYLAGGGLNLPIQHYNPGQPITLQLRAVENDDLFSTALSAADDCESNYITRTFTIASNQRNSPIVIQQWVTDQQYHPAGQNVKFNFDITVYDNAPILSTPFPAITGDHGTTLSFTGVSVTDNEILQSCDYDFDYDGSFNADFNAGTSCSGFSISANTPGYPNMSGSGTYAVRVTDSFGATDLDFGSWDLTNYNPLLTFTNLSQTTYQPNENILLHWNITDLNPMNAELLINGSLIEVTDYSMNGGSTFSTDTMISLISDGIYNLTVVLSDRGGLTTSSTQFVEIITPTLTGLDIITPTEGDFINEVEITWEPALDNYDNPVEYSISFSQNDGTTFNPLVSGLTTTSYTWDTTAMERGLFYKVKIDAVSDAGSLSVVSDTFRLRETHSISTPVLISPSLDTPLNGLVSIEWQESVDNWDHDLVYSIFYKNTTSSTYNQISVNITETQIQFDTTLVPDGIYVLKIEVSDGLEIIFVESGSFEIDNSIGSTSAASSDQSISEPSSSNSSAPGNTLPIPGFELGYSIIPLFIFGTLILRRKKSSL